MEKSKIGNLSEWKQRQELASISDAWCAPPPLALRAELGACELHINLLSYVVWPGLVW